MAKSIMAKIISGNNNGSVKKEMAMKMK